MGFTFWALYSTSRMLLSSSMQASSSSPFSMSSCRMGTAVCSSSSRHSVGADRQGGTGLAGAGTTPAPERTGQERDQQDGPGPARCLV